MSEKFGFPPRNLSKKKSRARFVKITGYERVDFLSSGCLLFSGKNKFAPESVIATTKCGWRFRRDACIAMHVLALGMLLAHIDSHTGIDPFGGETTEATPGHDFRTGWAVAPEGFATPRDLWWP